MKNKIVKLISLSLIIFIVFFVAMPLETLAAESVASDKIETTLTDVELQRGSIISFDVWARDSKGEKIDCSVTLNGQDVQLAWNDVSKTSYKPKFTKAGENIIVITAGDASKTFTINYVHTAVGEVIGKVTVSVETFALGGGYLVDPVSVDINEGENAAQLLDRILKENGYAYRNTGSLTCGFYLAAIVGGRLPIEANIPEVLKNKMIEINYADENEESLGEFNYTMCSGWMYCVNGIFPNVGFSDYRLSDGDVMRVQFTLSYGSDLGGGSAMGYDFAEDYYVIADKGELTKLIAEKGIKNVPEEVLQVATKIDSTQADVDGAINILKSGKVYGDVSNHWAKNSIYFASANNLLQGMGGEIAAILQRYMSLSLR